MIGSDEEESEPAQVQPKSEPKPVECMRTLHSPTHISQTIENDFDRHQLILFQKKRNQKSNLIILHLIKSLSHHREKHPDRRRMRIKSQTSQPHPRIETDHLQKTNLHGKTKNASNRRFRSKPKKLTGMHLMMISSFRMIRTQQVRNLILKKTNTNQNHKIEAFHSQSN